MELYDTTLRDGAQTEGISFSLQDKLVIARALDRLGIDYIEGGWPSSNPKDASFFKEIKREKLDYSKIVAFGATSHPKNKPGDDPNLLGLIDAGTDIVTIFGKSWDLHVKSVLKVSLERNLQLIKDSISFLKSKGKWVFFDAEHFFDGYKNNPKYAKNVIEIAANEGAWAVILCDTNGGCLPQDIEKIIRELNAKFPLGIHCHDDSDMAEANTLSAVLAGCSHIQGTINGYGERCGNANLITIIPLLKFKLGINTIPDEKMRHLTEISRLISEIANIPPNPHQPYVGQSSFSHKGGVHASAVLRHPKTYEHIDPELVGNTRKILISELAGRASILHKASDYNIGLDSRKAKRLLKVIKNLEEEGYQFEAADASFELLIDKELGRYKPSFKIEGWRVIVEKRDEGRLISEATIKLDIGGGKEYTVAEGDGPVNALDNAIRKALLKFYPVLSEIHLTDYKVRIVNPKEGTAAKVMVLIESSDKEKTWGTVGVSKNIIEASTHALVDAIEYVLKRGKPSKNE